jgi:hypothetical protein
MLTEDELGALRLESSIKEVSTELKDVGGFVFEDFAVEGIDFVLIRERKRPGRHWWGGGEEEREKRGEGRRGEE